MKKKNPKQTSVLVGILIEKSCFSCENEKVHRFACKNIYKKGIILNIKPGRLHLFSDIFDFFSQLSLKND